MVKTLKNFHTLRVSTETGPISIGPFLYTYWPRQDHILFTIKIKSLFVLPIE